MIKMNEENNIVNCNSTTNTQTNYLSGYLSKQDIINQAINFTNIIKSKYPETPYFDVILKALGFVEELVTKNMNYHNENRELKERIRKLEGK
jgi:hypothetical protein